MDAKISLSKDIFVNRFLNPLSKLSERAIIEITNENISSSVMSEDMSVSACISIKDEFSNTAKLNINNLKKFNSLLSHIPEDNFIIDIGSNYLKYSGKNIRFKYHILEDGIIKSPPINFEKVKDFHTDISFELSGDKIKEIIKLSVVSAETKQKVYVNFSNTGVFAELTDKTVENCDSVICQINNEVYEKEILDIPFSFTLLQILSYMKLDYIFKYNIEKGVAIIYSNLDNIEYIFVSSSLTN